MLTKLSSYGPDQLRLEALSRINCGQGKQRDKTGTLPNFAAGRHAHKLDLGDRVGVVKRTYLSHSLALAVSVETEEFVGHVLWPLHKSGSTEGLLPVEP